ncbi:N(G),N(G)-dimethylarginine dimethylaminohydrolase 1 [Bactrocera neohumeralis]|uniref:N(G),N(G)-dimethylarginine dimethylaminohydrolase 1 n=1 Tax=Bactrocera tryoni TaxID=59916 RepID=UPI001A97E547|nr:N(G),N(G)-dimethylarginine dimethylaminohydrolase 1 [Bactrocera tryoni]XP_050328366.1 N(G),N(G)-dimethylarginine dimethylaminohydrolase 1 [Bactrocera neohumeralis]
MPPQRYTHAIVARISDTIKKNGEFDYDKAKQQHQNFCSLLRDIGLDVIELPPDETLPEGVFVENAAIICNGVALMSKSDNLFRQREADSMEIILKKELDIPVVNPNIPNAILDGGDVLFTGREFFVGISNYTNEDGAKSVAVAFPEYPVTPIKVSGNKRLKYYVAMAGPDVLSVSTSIYCQEIVKRMEREASFKYQKITLPEEYAANMIYVNGFLIHRSPEEIPASYKVIKEKIDTPSRNINISEFGQFSSGLTSACLLLRRWKSIRNI